MNRETDCTLRYDGLQELNKTSTLEPSDMVNIYSAFETAEPDIYFRLWKRKRPDMLISEFFNYLCKNAKTHMDKYIEQYLHLKTKEEKNGFWLRFKK